MRVTRRTLNSPHKGCSFLKYDPYLLFYILLNREIGRRDFTRAIGVLGYCLEDHRPSGRREE